MFFSCRPRQTPRPSRPQCLYSGCSHRALRCDSKSEGKAMLSLYCKDHACRQRLGELMCPNYKASGFSKYCEDHRRCENQGCPQQRICSDTSQEWPYCQNHTCFHQGCHQKRASNSRMCVHHTPLCLIPGCGHPRVDDGLYCPSHSCTDRDCNSVINGGHWCKDHRLCKIEGCGLQRAVTAGGKYEDVCWQHLPTACLSPDCVNTINGSLRFCSQHECAYPLCREQKDNASDPSRLYCATHTCNSQSCPQPTADLANPSAARYCVTHKCASAACTHPSKPASRHCAMHACLHASCPSPRAADPLVVSASQFCSTHECHATGCHGPARPNGSYCETAHACAVPGCPAPRGMIGGVGVSDGTGAASVCCASHTAMIARESAAAWSLYPAGERRSMPSPVQTQPQPQQRARPQRFSYISQAEETLGQRLREERERQDHEARLDLEMRTWQAARGVGGGVGVESSSVSGAGATVGLETRGRGVRGGRSGSHDSGFGGSPSVSDLTSSNNTFVG
ncbi:hypothetical protein QIS74_03518 [Colletotrichum tabaci]|uniref:Uncharacterized protein n=1 Tax=Colletotrichum tabaci TaxID=1209068 RepID=A0AAV9TKH4_9PEZI